MGLSLQKAASLIAKREGKKSQTSIGNIREILKVIEDLESEALLANESDVGFEWSIVQGLANRADKKYSKLKLKRKLNKVCKK